MMKRYRAAALLTALTLSLTACGSKTEPTAPADSGIAVQVETILPDTISSESKVSGKVAADSEATILISSPGKCTAIHAQPGDQVKAGDVLCTLDLGSALSSYNAARINSESAAQSYQDQKGILDRQVRMASDNVANTKALFEIGAASQLEVEQAELNYETAVAGRNATLSQLEAGIQSARSGLEQLDFALDDVDPSGNVIAPISGTLVSLNVTENAPISNAAPLAVINGAGQMKILVSVSEALVPKLAIGDKADVSVGAVDKTFPAVIRSVERSADLQTKLYDVVLTVPPEVSGLLAGMFADVTFHTDVSENALVVPTEAILTQNDTTYVYIAEDGIARRREVQTGLTGSGVTEILSGLSEGEQLVTVGQAYLADGDPVRIVAAPDAPQENDAAASDPMPEPAGEE